MKGNFQIGDIVKLTSNTNPKTKFIISREPNSNLVYGAMIYPRGKREVMVHESEMELIKRK